MAHQRGHREPGDLEVGANDLFLEHARPHLPERPPPPRWLTRWECARPVWLQELVAEFFGVFLLTWLGFGATASMILSKGAGGSLFTVSLCYGIGITLGILVAGPNSGGHLHPAYTIAFALFKGFPWRKVPAYILAQCLGGFCAALLVYAQCAPQMSALKASILAAGDPSVIFSPQGPSGMMAIYPPPGSGMGTVVLNELVASGVLAAVIFSVLDPSNPFIVPAAGPWVIGVAFSLGIAAYAGNGVALNTARDVGPRLAAAIIWGRGALPPRFSASAALTNILGTVIGAAFQTLWLSDSVRPYTPGSVEMQAGLAKQAAAVHSRAMTTKLDYGEKGVANVTTLPADYSEKSSA